MPTAKQTETDTEIDSMPVWRFDNPPKQLICTIERIRTAHMTGVNGEPFSYPLLFVRPRETPDAVTLVHAYPEVLLNELKSVRPQPGDEITIRYLGKKRTKNQRTAAIFEVTGGEGVEQMDWDNPGF